MPRIFVEQLSIGADSIDLNGHVNNVRYIEWMMDCVNEKDGGNTRKIGDFEIIFRAEAFLSENATAHSASLNGDGDHAHLVSAAGRDLAVARSSWRDFNPVREGLHPRPPAIPPEPPKGGSASYGDFS